MSVRHANISSTMFLIKHEVLDQICILKTIVLSLLCAFFNLYFVFSCFDIYIFVALKSKSKSHFHTYKARERKNAKCRVSCAVLVLCEFIAKTWSCEKPRSHHAVYTQSSLTMRLMHNLTDSIIICMVQWFPLWIFKSFSALNKILETNNHKLH